MKQLSIDELHGLRLRIFDNAESLHKEAKVLLDAGFHARAYLLAHFACEELGKLPIIVGIVGSLMKNEVVDWNKAMKRLRDHKSKVDSDDFHQYVFGRELDLLADSDLEWLKEARAKATQRVELKNNATYVDVSGTSVVSPMDAITSDDATKMIERAFDSLRAHWQAETLINPLLREASAKVDDDAAD